MKIIGSNPIKAFITKGKRKMSLIRMNLKYIKNDSASREFFSTGGKINYISRNDAVVKFLGAIDKNSDSFSNQISLNQQEYAKKTNSGLFKLDNGKSMEIDPREGRDTFNSIQNQIIWDGYISISKNSSDEFKFGDVQDWTNLVEKFIPQLLKTEKMNLNNLNFFYSVHGNTNNPHMHFIFFEKNKEFLDDVNNLTFRKKGKFQIENISTFQNVASSFIKGQNDYRNDYLLKQKIWENKLSLKQIIKNDYIFGLNDSIHSVIEEANENNVKHFKKLSGESKSKILNYFYQEINEFNLRDKNSINDFLNSLNEPSKNVKFKSFLEKEKEGFLNDVGNIVFNSIKFNLLEDKELKINDVHEFNLLDQQNDVSTNLLKQRRKSTLLNLQTHLNSFDWTGKIDDLKKYKEMELGQ